MNKIKIFVACHKPCEVKKDDVHVPIHVGREISKFKEEMSDMVGDDSGDNISNKNPYYCEMTAQYWAWKNYSDTEYIGFCHYRRYFAEQITSDNFKEYFKIGTEVIVNSPRYRAEGRMSYLLKFVCSEDVAIMQKALLRLYPEYFETYKKYSDGFVDYIGNMFICRKDIFDQYAEWIFTILSECEKCLRLSPYTRARRVYGYLAEYLMPVYFMHNGKLVPLPYLDMYGKKQSLGKKDKVKIYIKNFLHRKDRSSKTKIDPSVEVGLKMDGIIE